MLLRLRKWIAPHPDDGEAVAHLGVSPGEHGIEPQLVELVREFGLPSIREARGHPPYVHSHRAWVRFVDVDGRRHAALCRTGSATGLASPSTPEWDEAATYRGYVLLTARADVFAGQFGVMEFAGQDAHRTFAGLVQVRRG